MGHDILRLNHLEWLVKSRAVNQLWALKLFTLFEKYPEEIKQKKLNIAAYNLAAVCFSLWRAAFLAEKVEKPDAVFQDAKAFLEKILVDNAIGYPADRSSREWTFSYYMNTAFDRLTALPGHWEIAKHAEPDIYSEGPGPNYSHRRWDAHQIAFQAGVERLAKELGE